jgi:hypothetical protein
MSVKQYSRASSPTVKSRPDLSITFGSAVSVATARSR